MTATTPLVAFFDRLPVAWEVDPLKDQGIAGGLARSYGELPSVLLLLLIMSRWERDDTRKSRRADRATVRKETADLDAYNNYLQSLSKRRY